MYDKVERISLVPWTFALNKISKERGEENNNVMRIDRKKCGEDEE